MGTALYVSPEQATGQPLTGSSDVYSLGVVAYECLAGDPPFVADQPLAIAIMHKHDPVPPLPNDVPRPVADLVYAMLAKNPEDRPETARHVADRADVIREARFRSGYSGPVTSDLPVVPNFPPATSMDLYQNDAQRMPPAPRWRIAHLLVRGDRGGGHRRRRDYRRADLKQRQRAEHRRAAPRLLPRRSRSPRATRRARPRALRSR